MKKMVFLICGVIALIFGMEANAQKPYNMDELYEIGKLSKGSISDFVSWMLAEPEDELNGPMSEAWNLYRKNKPLDKGTTIFLDEKNRNLWRFVQPDTCGTCGAGEGGTGGM